MTPRQKRFHEVQAAKARRIRRSAKKRIYRTQKALAADIRAARAQNQAWADLCLKSQAAVAALVATIKRTSRTPHRL